MPDPAPILPYARQSINDEDIAAVVDALRSPLVTQGPCLEAFEARLAAITGAPHAIVVSSGTAALHLACLGSVDWQPGDGGLTSAITFAAGANCFRYCGAEACFMDINPATGLVTPETVARGLADARALGVRPKMVVVVSLAGQVPDLPAIAEICRQNDCLLLEDAAHSLGAVYRDSSQNSHPSASCHHSDLAILSFHPVKHICTGEGGAILCRDPVLAQRLRRLRSHGIHRPAPTPSASLPGWWYEQTELGFHYRMTELQAALGLSQLRRLPGFLERRRHLAARYTVALAKTPFSDWMHPLACPCPEDHAFHLYVIRTRETNLRRDLYETLKTDGIHSQVHYIPVYQHPYHASSFKGSPLPGAETYYDSCLSLPLFPSMDEQDQDRVLDSIRKVLAKM